MSMDITQMRKSYTTLLSNDNTRARFVLKRIGAEILFASFIEKGEFSMP